jgi:hypothetical protein
MIDPLSFPKIPSARFFVEDLASMVKPGIFIVDDVALPTPITFLVLLGEKAVAAKRWARLFEQPFRVDKWSVCRG